MGAEVDVEENEILRCGVSTSLVLPRATALHLSAGLAGVVF